MSPVKPITTLGLFGRVYGLMLGGVLVAEALLIALIAVTAPPVPGVVAYDELLRALGPSAEEVGPLTVTMEGAARLEREASGASDLLALAVARDLGVSRSDVRAKVSVLTPPVGLGVWPETRVAEGVRPSFVAGDFIVERRLATGQWLRVTSGQAFAAAVARRFALLLAFTSLIVAIPAYLLAGRLTRPFAQFASAAERLGRDPLAPPLTVSGPVEVRTAAIAFNEMQARLRRYIEDRTSMVTAIAHDLRTPLTRMSFIAADADETVQPRLMRQIQEMQGMISAVLAYLGAERQRYERVAVDVGSVIDAVCQNAAETDSRLRAPPYERAIILGDPEALASIVRNLVDNALTTSATTVVVLVEITAEAVCVRVEDDGPGLAPELLTRVFEPFVRADPSRSRSTGGVGLGLTLVRSAVLAHGGAVSLTNRSPHGLSAEVRLPRWSA